MKRTRQRLFLIFILLVVTLGIFFVYTIFNTFFTPSIKTPLSYINKNNTYEIAIYDGNQTIDLTKKNGQWLQMGATTSLLADTDRINTLIDDLTALKEDAVVSTNPQNQKNFGIDKQKIEIKTQQKNTTIYIGNTAGMGQDYVRVEGSNVVFIADNLDTVFTPFDYRDLSLHLIGNENNVDLVEIDASQNKTILQMKNNGWEVDSKPALRERVDFFINDVKTLKAQNIATASSQLIGLPDLTLTIEEKSQKRSVSFYIKGDNSYDAQIIGQNITYEVASPYVTALQKTTKDFIE